MIILDKPFVSDFLIETIRKQSISVLDSDFSKTLNLDACIKRIKPEKAIADFNSNDFPQIYSNSENSIDWVCKHLNHTTLPDRIHLFKNKVLFRDLLKKEYPDFFYKEIDYKDIPALDIADYPKPFIIKPVVGFFSMGVYKVFSEKDWDPIPALIYEEVKRIGHLYPMQVMNHETFIVEEMIEGEEFAFDVYFNTESEPVILGIFKHVFSSGNDVGDRVYFTSKDLIEKHINKFQAFCLMLGEAVSLKNFPMHIEVRLTDKGDIVPIEINPMRFGGWCTTADLTFKAFGINPYEYYFKQQKPDWTVILKKTTDANFCLVVLDNSTGYDSTEIEDFDYNLLLSKFTKTIELRKIDWNEYPVFGFLLVEFDKSNFSEMEYILKSDLKEFVTLKK